jgi:3-carboxy-cis,cis-muconate cycloisomerase
LPLISSFGDEETNAVFSPDAYLETCCFVEVKLAEAEAAVGVVPAGAVPSISEAASAAVGHDAEIWDEARLVGYPILPLVRVLARLAGEDGQYVHWGATTQDIMDTALVLQVRRGLVRIEALLEELGDHIAVHATQHAGTPIAGRTHGQHAVPTTFGAKCASWLDELIRHLERLEALRPRLFRVQLSGAAGTLASLGDDAGRVRAELARRLDLVDSSAPWHSARDCLGELGATLALVDGTIARIAREIANLARTEIGEVSEEHSHLRGASSTMPQKRNPVLSEAAFGLANLGITYASALPHAMQAEHERAAGEWQIEWDAIPLIFATTGGALARAVDVMRGLQIDAARMRSNLLSHPSTMSEALMMLLASRVGRQRAHALVYRAVQRAHERGESLIAAVAGDDEVGAALTREEVKEVMSVDAYLGEAPQIALEVSERWRRIRAGRCGPQ